MNKLNPAIHHIPALDGIRGTAILLVLIVHIYYRGPTFETSAFASNIFILGWTGVDLFFVLSGFLITSILLKIKEQEQSLYTFYVNRLGRILPLYIILMAALFTFSVINLGTKINIMIDNFLQYWYSYFFFLSNLSEIIGWNTSESDKILGSLWSVSIEEQYYLFWPAVVILISREKLRYIAPFVLVVLILFRFNIVGFVSSNIIYHFTLTHLDGILIGSMLAIYIVEIERISAAMISLIISVISGLLLVVFMLAGTTHYSDPIVQKYGYTLIAAFYAAAVIITLKSRHISNVFSFKPMTLLGKYSYFIYLYHWPLLLMLNQIRFPQGLLSWSIFSVLFIALMMGLGSLSLKYVERPAATYIRAFGVRARSSQQS